MLLGTREDRCEHPGEETYMELENHHCMWRARNQKGSKASRLRDWEGGVAINSDREIRRETLLGILIL